MAAAPFPSAVPIASAAPSSAPEVAPALPAATGAKRRLSLPKSSPAGASSTRRTILMGVLARVIIGGAFFLYSSKKDAAVDPAASETPATQVTTDPATTAPAAPTDPAAAAPTTGAGDSVPTAVDDAMGNGVSKAQDLAAQENAALAQETAVPAG
ncbi:MAG: hypothetical protein H7287_01170, partial [Thermoleophilia bacterium]|nr:hypothetical protein [Thermoleophilia bacterium]